MESATAGNTVATLNKNEAGRDVISLQEVGRSTHDDDDGWDDLLPTLSVARQPSDPPTPPPVSGRSKKSQKAKGKGKAKAKVKFKSPTSTTKSPLKLRPAPAVHKKNTEGGKVFPSVQARLICSVELLTEEGVACIKSGAELVGLQSLRKEKVKKML